MNTTGELGLNRFRLNEISRIKLGGYRLLYEKFSLENPSIVGTTIFGSQVVGRARSDSDIDSYLFIDEDIWNPNGVKNPDARVAIEDNDKDWFEAMTTLGYNFRNLVGEKLGLTEVQRIEIRTRLLSKVRIDNEINALMGYTKKRHNFSSVVYPNISIDKLFHLQLGRGLDGYRAYILGVLKQEGALGELVWQQMMETVEMMERRLQVSRDPKIFPQTVDQAFKKFRLEHTKPKYPIPDKTDVSGVHTK